MSTLEMMRCIRDAMGDDDWAQHLRDHDAPAIVERYGLSGDETAALLTGDVRELTERGVHPFSLVQLSRVMRFDLLARWSEINARTT